MLLERSRRRRGVRRLRVVFRSLDARLVPARRLRSRATDDSCRTRKSWDGRAPSRSRRRRRLSRIAGQGAQRVDLVTRRARRRVSGWRTRYAAGRMPGGLASARRERQHERRLRRSIESWRFRGYLMHSDRMGLAHGVEGRVPLLDDGVMREAFAIPPAQRRRLDRLEGEPAKRRRRCAPATGARAALEARIPRAAGGLRPSAR